MLGTIEVSVGDERPLYYDWRNELATVENAATISSSAWTIDPLLTLTSSEILNWPAGSKQATIVTSGGNATRVKVIGWQEGKTYPLKNVITLSDGQKLAGFMQVKVGRRSGKVSSIHPTQINS